MIRKKGRLLFVKGGLFFYAGIDSTPILATAFQCFIIQGKGGNFF
jgi:hypothetical protein